VQNFAAIGRCPNAAPEKRLQQFRATPLRLPLYFDVMILSRVVQTCMTSHRPGLGRSLRRLRG